MFFKNLYLLTTVMLLSISCATEQFAGHPIPKEPSLISKDLMPVFKKSLSLPPAEKSQAQKDDEKSLFEHQKMRDESDCKRAKTEVQVGLVNFYGQPYGNLSKKEVDQLTPFFEQVRNDADYYVQQLKTEYPRPRPFNYIKGLIPCVPKEVTGAYPSGHATLSRLYALILSDIFPDRKMSFIQRADVIAANRVISGMHHPSDIKAGKELGELLFKEFKKSRTYQELFNKYYN